MTGGKSKTVALCWLAMLLPATAAHAAPPTIDSVTEPAARQVQVTWTLPEGMQNYTLEVARDPATVQDGDNKGAFLPENRLAYAFLLTTPATTWFSPNRFPLGSVWVHVSAIDPLTCTGPLGLGCQQEFSAPVHYEVWRPVVGLGSVGQTKRFLTANWGAESWIYRTFIEVAVSPETRGVGPAKDRFLDRNTVFVEDTSAWNYQSSRKLPGGRYWVHVGGYERDTCPDPLTTTCIPEISATREQVIQPDPPVLTGAWHDGGRPRAAWVLPSDMFVDFIEIATSPAVYPDGPFAGEFLEENTVLFDDTVALRETLYEGAEALPPGTYYVHVAGFVSSFCPTPDAITCVDEFSGIKQFTVPAPPAAASPPTAASAPSDSTAFTALHVAAKQSIRRLRVTAAMGERGTLEAYGTVSTTKPARVFRLRPVTAAAQPGRAVKLRLSLPRKSLKAVTRALRHGGQATAKLKIVAKDRAGYMKTERRTIRLRR